jgi:hypothetical protein
MIPKPNPENKCQQSKQRFGIILPQQSAIGIPRETAGFYRLADGFGGFIKKTQKASFA